MQLNAHVDPSPPVRRQIDGMDCEACSILKVATRASIFPGCQCHDITIGRGTFTKALVIHAQGIALLVGAEARRKRMGGNGVALIWADVAGKVTGGGFTTASVPADWRNPPKPSARAAMAEQVIEANQVKAAEPAGFKRKVNTYTCDSCDKVTVTVDIDDGVTPFMIGCPFVRCAGGSAKSAMYRVDQGLVPTQEWFRPTDLSGYSAMVRQHVEMGGLVMRPRVV